MPDPTETSGTASAQDPELEQLLSDFDHYMDSSSHPESTTTAQADVHDIQGGHGSNDPALQSATPTATAHHGTGSENQSVSFPSSATGSTALSSLALIFPSENRERLRATLEAHGGSVERAVDFLLLEGAEKGERKSESDEAMARRLAQEEEQGRNGDYRMAVGLQRAMDLEARREEERELERLVKWVREGLEEGVKRWIKEAGLNDARGVKQSVEWGLSAMQLVCFDIPEGGVKVRRIGRAVGVRVTGALLEIRVGRWEYKREGWIPIQDSGTASVVVSGVSASLNIGWGGLVGDTLAMVEGTVKMKTGDSTVDWLYNMIGMVMKSVLGDYVASVVGDALKSAVLERMQLWEIASSAEKEGQASATAENATNRR